MLDRSEEEEGLTTGIRQADVASADTPADPSPKAWKSISVSQFFWTVVAGLIFGWALQRCGVGMASVIQDQFTFSQNTMLIMFLSASATSALTIGALKSFAHTESHATESGEKYLKAPHQGLAAVGLGGVLIGIGMAISGTCPGTIWAQLGSAQPKALISFGGALVGAGIIALTNKHLQAFTELWVLKNRTLASLLAVSDFAAAALLAVVFLVVVVAVLFIPGAYTPLPGAQDGFSAQYWHPMIGGAMVGLVQLPLVLGVKRNVGASTSFSVLASLALERVGLANKYTGKMTSGTSWWSVLFVTVATVGAALSAWSGNTWYPWDAMNTVTPAEAFVGGVLLLLGSRLASGCTSGHGISGVGHAAIASLVGVCGIFAGGIVTAFARQAIMGM